MASLCLDSCFCFKGTCAKTLLTSKKETGPSGSKLTASRGVEFELEILEAEHAFVADKVGQLQEKD
ncbi:hypothetical protein HanIR_Chr17g0849311 [Helianthus annuus]|nr:hypothetical protein HanIR_Chr17g0849311 [Helianthus annuus]